MAKLYPLFSGSKGNCYYVGSGNSGVLIDVGMTAKQTELLLNANEIPVENIKGIFVTHEHSDHIKGIKVFASRYGIDIYGSNGTIQELINKDLVTAKYNANVIDYNGLEMCNMKIVPFKTSHDCSESTGFVVHTADGQKCAIATDTGVVTQEMKESLYGCNVVVIESNHDVNMLLNGMYPYLLKRRILSSKGHLSNDACSEFLPELVKNGTTRLVLGHLSEENNMVQLAKQSAICALHEQNMKLDKDYKLMVAPVKNSGQVVIY